MEPDGGTPGRRCEEGCVRSWRPPRIDCKRDSLVITRFGDEDAIYSFDHAGRLFAVWHRAHLYCRALDGRVMEKFTDRRPAPRRGRTHVVAAGPTRAAARGRSSSTEPATKNERLPKAPAAVHHKLPAVPYGTKFPNPTSRRWVPSQPPWLPAVVLASLPLRPEAGSRELCVGSELPVRLAHSREPVPSIMLAATPAARNHEA